VGQRSLKVIEISAIRKFGCGFLFAFCSNYGRNYSRLWISRMAVSVANQKDSSPFAVDKWLEGCDKMSSVHHLNLGRRHLVNAYEVKAGIGCNCK